MTLFSDVFGAVKHFIASGSAKCFEGHSKGVTAVDFSYDGKWIASGGNDATVRVYDVRTGKQTHCFTLSADSIDIQRVAFSRDGRRLLAIGMHLGGFGRGAGMTYVFDLEEGREIKRFEGKPAFVVSPNGRHVVSTGRDTTIRVWEFETGKEISRLCGHGGDITSLAISPDGKYLYSGSADTSIRMWNMENFHEVKRFIGHMDAVCDITLSPSGTMLASAGLDATIRLWSVDTAAESHRFDSDSRLEIKLAFGSGGRRLVARCPDSIRRWDTKTGQMLPTHPLELTNTSHVIFSRNGNFAIVCASDGSFSLMATETMKEIKKFTGHTWGVHCAALDPNDNIMITGSGDNTVRLWTIPMAETPNYQRTPGQTTRSQTTQGTRPRS